MFIVFLAPVPRVNFSMLPVKRKLDCFSSSFQHIIFGNRMELERVWSVLFKVFSNLLICNYWSLGAVDYPGFRGLLKQLVGPLSTQLSDRRSSIVKQVC